MRAIGIIALLTTLLPGTGCTDNDPVAPVFGRASAGVTDGTAETMGQRTGTPATSGDVVFSGQFSASGLVEVSVDGESWVELGSPSSFLVELQRDGEESLVQADVQIPVGTYTRVRLTLTSGRVELDEDVTLGGSSFAGGIAIAVGGEDGTVVIEKQVQPFTVGVDNHARLRFDLNSELWVTEISASSRAVSDHEVRRAAVASRSVSRTD